MQDGKDIVLEKIEQIGKITLDYSRYPGEDLYCDGAVEDELLEMVQAMPAKDYRRAIEEKKSWPILYHLSSLRENIVEWIPLKPTDKVLEVGSGCGAITGALARKAGEVTCVDLSRKRSRINAYRHSECENVAIRVGNFKDIEPDLENDYDYIFLIGVFEYGQSYIGGDTPFEDFLKILLRHLQKDGRIVIAIENKYGLKYFAGCKEDHLGTYFSGIENYAAGGGVRTFGRAGLEQIFQNCGITESHFYYPYPDYKFMTTLYSDKRLPGKGELSDNLRNFDRDRMKLFDEKSAFDGLTQEGLFPVFSNSYLAVIGRDWEPVYEKYSNDRTGQYCIRTEIGESKEYGAYVRKYPLTKEAEAHICHMAEAYQRLSEKYRGGRLVINPCTIHSEGELYAQFAFEKGTPLSQLMDACLEKEDIEGFYRLFTEYLERVDYHREYAFSDLDLIFANLLVEGDTWTLIDYEWTAEKSVPIKESAYRAVYCYLLENEKRKKIDSKRIRQLLQITQEEAEAYVRQETEFQAKVTGGGCSLSQLRDLIGYRVMVPQKWIERYQDTANVNCVQIYEDTGAGYREEGSYFVRDAYCGENHIEFTIPVREEVKHLRIDPSMDSCMVTIKNMTFNGERIPLEKRKIMAVNGKVARSAEHQPTIVFPTTDPNISLALKELEGRAENTLHVELEIVRIPMQMAQNMAGAVKKIL